MSKSKNPQTGISDECSLGLGTELTGRDETSSDDGSVEMKFGHQGATLNVERARRPNTHHRATEGSQSSSGWPEGTTRRKPSWSPQDVSTDGLRGVRKLPGATMPKIPLTGSAFGLGSS